MALASPDLSWATSNGAPRQARDTTETMVEAGGVEPNARVESTQVIDFTLRQKRQNRSKRPIRLRGSYADAQLVFEARPCAPGEGSLPNVCPCGRLVDRSVGATWYGTRPAQIGACDALSARSQLNHRLGASALAYEFMSWRTSQQLLARRRLSAFWL